MEPTTLCYLDNMHLLDLEAKVLAVVKDNDDFIVILDQTIFYPQGGGQPSDQGIMVHNEQVFNVQQVRLVESIVQHRGMFERDSFIIGQKVLCKVNKEKRSLHNRLHSAGHIVDLAIACMEFPWIPGKGYHFPNGPYVEYEGSLEGLDKEHLKRDIEATCNALINEDRQVNITFVALDEVKKLCRHVPSYLSATKPVRIVTYGDFNIPCGGTHVSHLKDIKSITIRKIKQEGPHIRVGYDIG